MPLGSLSQMPRAGRGRQSGVVTVSRRVDAVFHMPRHLSKVASAGRQVMTQPPRQLCSMEVARVSGHGEPRTGWSRVYTVTASCRGVFLRLAACELRRKPHTCLLGVARKLKATRHRSECFAKNPAGVHVALFCSNFCVRLLQCAAIAVTVREKGQRTRVCNARR